MVDITDLQKENASDTVTSAGRWAFAPPAHPVLLGLVAAWCVALTAVAAVADTELSQIWPDWPFAFAAAATWGLNLLVVVYGIGPPFCLSRAAVLAPAFALLMTLFGSGSYWATIQLYPDYRVGIERAAWLVAACTCIALLATVGAGKVLRRLQDSGRRHLQWDWPRLSAVTFLVFAVATVGTVITVRRIGYVPILSGDPASVRVEFPLIGGIWYRLSMLGGVAALLVAVQAAARRAGVAHYSVGLASLAMVGLYGPRFFVALPLGVSILLWDRVRARVRLAWAMTFVLVGAPVLALVGYWRQQDPSVALLGPFSLVLYGILGEFRDLGWALDYYGFGDRFLHGGTLGGLVVPLLPTPVWHLVGIDKAAIYAHSSASVLADAMGQTTGQRIGAYGEFFINFGWWGALVGAVLYGILIAYLDNRYRGVQSSQVRAVFFALAIAATVFAQIGQLNMFTSTLTGYGYPLGLIVLVAAWLPRARRASF